MATKKKAAKPAKKTATVKKIAPAKKSTSKPAQTSGSGKAIKKAPAAKSIAKPIAKRLPPHRLLQKNPPPFQPKRPLYPIYLKQHPQRHNHQSQKLQFSPQYQKHPRPRLLPPPLHLQ